MTFLAGMSAFLVGYAIALGLGADRWSFMAGYAVGVVATIAMAAAP